MIQLPIDAIQGLDAFNSHDFYEAHELFEKAWRETPDDSRELYRGLLHLSGGCYRLTQGRPEAARKFFKRALHWITPFPEEFLGIEICQITLGINNLLISIDQNKDSQKILELNLCVIQYASNQEEQ